MERLIRSLTVEADIVFEDKEGLKFAIEIETGINYRQHKQRLEEKFTRLRNQYGKKAVILLTKLKRADNYKKYGIKVLGREQICKWIDEVLDYPASK